jgi:hypothetical protein
VLVIEWSVVKKTVFFQRVTDQNLLNNVILDIMGHLLVRIFGVLLVETHFFENLRTAMARILFLELIFLFCSSLAIDAAHYEGFSVRMGLFTREQMSQAYKIVYGDEGERVWGQHFCNPLKAHEDLEGLLKNAPKKNNEEYYKSLTMLLSVYVPEESEENDKSVREEDSE